MIISKTPFRISFFGGGTDYPEYFAEHGGAVLGTAIDKFAFVSATRLYSQLFDYNVRVAYREVECVNDVSSIRHGPFRECLRTAGITSGIEVDYTAELPSSTGLGTSSSFVVGVLNTLNAFRGRLTHPLELAYQAIEIERERLGESVGCQDQTFAAVGGFNLLEFRTTRDIVVHRVLLTASAQRDFESHLMLIYTGIRRRASHVAARQVRKIRANKGLLAEMRRLVDDGYSVLTGSGNLARFGQLLDDAWSLKNQLDNSVSNAAIDDIYRTARQAGALGGKLLGAGGGGFVALFVPPERRRQVREALAHLEEVPVRVNAAGTHIIQSERKTAAEQPPHTDTGEGQQQAA